MEKLEWSALEYEEKERSSDWFWALGIIVLTATLSAMIYSNYFFALLIVLAGLLLGYFALKEPDIVSYELNPKGLRVRNRLYPHENIKSFWVQIDTTGETNLKPTLFVKSERMFIPIISIPIEDSIASDIHSVMLSKNIIEEEMKDHPSLKIMEALGF